MTMDRDTEREAAPADDAYDDVAAAWREVSGQGEAGPVEEAAPSAPAETLDESPETESKDGPARDEHGRFTARQKEPEAAGKPDTETAETPDETEREPQQQPAAGPPPSWSVKSKAAWDALPAEVRADIAKREGEVAQGLAALRDYKDLKPYADLARQHNTTISESLKRYVGMEQLLSRDLGAGLAQITQNFGLSQPQAAQLFASLAQRFGNAQRQGGAGNGHTSSQADPLDGLLRPFLAPLEQRIATLTQSLESRAAADRNATAQTLDKAIEQFSANPENRFYPDLEETMTRLFETGQVPLTGDHVGDLRKAYETAAWMHPEVREALIEQRQRAAADAKRQREQEAAAKARTASRSITGSAAPGAQVMPRSGGSGFDDIEADVRAAMRAVGQG